MDEDRTATKPEAPAGKPESRATTTEAYGRLLTYLVAWTALAAIIRWWIGGALAAALIAAITLVALFAVVKMEPVLRRLPRRTPHVPWLAKHWRIAVTVAAFLLVGGGIGVASSALSSPTVPASATAGDHVQGTITLPHDGAAVTEGFPRVTGTVRNLEPGYRLLLFLQWTGDPRYLAGNPNVIVRNGHWSGPELINVGAHHAFVLWLVAQGPKTIKAMTTPLGKYRWGAPGFPSLKIAPDSIVLYHISPECVVRLSARVTGVSNRDLP